MRTTQPQGTRARGALRRSSPSALARRAGAWATAAALGLWASGALAADASDPSAPPCHHAAPEASRSSASYHVPDVELVRDDGKAVRLAPELDDGRPVVLTFIFTSCTTVCPTISATLAQLQRKLGPARDRVHLLSISIDPEFDTPARLRQYAMKFGAGPAWQHYTGTLDASLTVQRAFEVYRGDKMRHTPVTLLRSAPGAAWVRIDGFAGADQLLAELTDGRAGGQASVHASVHSSR